MEAPTQSCRGNGEALARRTLCSALAEGSDLESHTDDRREANREEEKSRNQGQRHRKDGFTMDEPFRRHRLP